MDLLSSCVYLSQVNAMSSKSRNQRESNGLLNAHGFSKNAVGRSMPKRKQFSIFNIFLRDEQSKSRKKERKATPGQFLFAISRFPSVHLLDRGVVIDSYCISSICM